MKVSALSPGMHRSNVQGVPNMLWDAAVLSPLISRTRNCYNLYDMQHQREVLRRQGIGYRTLKARVVARPCPMGTLLAPTGPMLQQSLRIVRGAYVKEVEAHLKEQSY